MHETYLVNNAFVSLVFKGGMPRLLEMFPTLSGYLRHLAVDHVTCDTYEGFRELGIIGGVSGPDT